MPRRRLPAGAVWFAVYLLALAAALVVGGLVLANVADQRASDQDRIDALSRGLTAANEQLEELGQPAASPTPEQIVDEPEVVETTTTLPPTTTTVPLAQIRAAVDRHLEANPPADGRPPTTEEIVSAVVAVCTATGGCNGRDGRDAPPPTGAQIQAAVASYCSDGRCRGPRGEPGQDGVDGADGVTPPCMSTPEQCQGATGQQGIQGVQGVQGPPGPIVPCRDLPAELGYLCAPVILPPPP
jgi:hypothetical protein